MTLARAKSGVGAIFDLDGTLIDTLDDIADSVNVVLEEFGRPRRSRSQVRSMVGEGLVSLMRRASEVAGPDELHELVARYREVYRERMFVHTSLYPGVASMLDALAERGVPLCVLSNKSHEFTVPLCSALLSQWSFVRVVGATEDAARKPDPAGALELSRAMALDPRQVWFVGDSDVDVETGRNAGMRTVAVTWGLRDRAELEVASPDVLADRPQQVADAVLNR